MAGWQKIAHGSVLDRFIILQKLQTKKFWHDFRLGSDDFVDGSEEDNLRCLFSLLLFTFHEQTCWSDYFRPKPSMLGDEKSVDLFKLYFLVKEKGFGFSRGVVGFRCQRVWVVIWCCF